MKLVDLNEVIDAIDSTDWYHINHFGELSEGADGDVSALYLATDIYKAIGEVPVVDAIPIEWIEEHFNRNYLSEYYHNAMMYFAKMKEDWQKEQEKQNGKTD